MRKFPPTGDAAAGVLAAALTAGAFAFTPAAGTARAAGTAAGASPPPLTSILPGPPIQVTGTPPPPQAATPRFAAMAARRLTSGNWAGYVATRKGVAFRFISARFYVPFLNCSGVTAAHPTYSSHWAGLDGFQAGSKTVEQAGVLAACYPNAGNVITPTYAAWYERYPNPPVYPRVTMHPGDAVTTSVYYNATTRAFTFSLADGTDGRHFSVSGKCPAPATCARASAEVISEAPSDGTSILPLADFQAASFTGVTVTSTGARKGGLASRWWNDYQIAQASDGTNLDSSGGTIPAGTPLNTPTPLLSSSTFSAYWMPGT